MEAIILTNEEVDFWTVFTYNKRLQRRLMSFAEWHHNIRKVFCECAKKHGLNEQGTVKTLVGLRESVQ